MPGKRLPRRMNFVYLLASFALLAMPALAQIEFNAPPAKADLAESWMKAPTISIMTGFIYEPLKPYTIQQWMENLGDKFDAEQWVKDFKETGAHHLVFYDKWIDGLVFHDTKTTNFKTKKDFVKELAAACQRQGLPLILYYNAVSDGNPEFDVWSLKDQDGKPIVFSPGWPTRYQTQHSPFHQKCIAQVHELLGYPISGIWHDIFHERINAISPWMAKGYEKMYGEPFAQAKRQRLEEFNARTLAGYLDEVYAMRRELGRGSVIFTANGSGSNFLNSGVWTDLVGSRLHYLFNEGHAFERNEELARMAWVLPKPLDINLLLTSSWFVPLEGPAPPAKWTEKQAIAASAIVVCQGAGVHWALTPDHHGVFGDDLKHAKLVGAWYRKVQGMLEGAQPFGEVGIVLGSPAPGGPGLPATNNFWRLGQRRTLDAWHEAVAITKLLENRGVFSRILFAGAQGGSWPSSLAGFKAILVPELAVLDDARLDALRQYVREGGRLIVFGHGSQLDAQGKPRPDYGLADVLGAGLAGEVDFPPQLQAAKLTVDSEYGKSFTAQNLLTGRGEAWSSGNTPMPHWIELALPKAHEIARIELVNRARDYQICDFDIQVPEGKGWKTVQAVRNANGATVSAKLDSPISSAKMRVTILRETFRKQDRTFADVKAIRVIDKAGDSLVGGRSASVPLQVGDPALAPTFGRASFPPLAVRVKPAGAQVVATLKDKPQSPAILKNTFGKGEAWLVTAGDASIEEPSELWTALARQATGEPLLGIDPQDAARYRVILTRVGGGHALHLIDKAVNSGKDYAPKAVTITLNADSLGQPRQAQEAGRDTPVPLVRQGRSIKLTVTPDPVASILLK